MLCGNCWSPVWLILVKVTPSVAFFFSLLLRVRFRSADQSYLQRTTKTFEEICYQRTSAYIGLKISIISKHNMIRSTKLGQNPFIIPVLFLTKDECPLLWKLLKRSNLLTLQCNKTSLKYFAWLRITSTQ